MDVVDEVIGVVELEVLDVLVVDEVDFLAEELEGVAVVIFGVEGTGVPGAGFAGDGVCGAGVLGVEIVFLEVVGEVPKKVIIQLSSAMGSRCCCDESSRMSSIM